MNTFYQEFDFAQPDPDREREDHRAPFQKDRDRIIYTSAFRRLQAKTQVFLSGEFDFYRTRLTHSIEVAQIGRSICGFLRRPGGPLTEEYHVDPDLVEAVCLAHDLGHPPFGHSGERTLQRLMRGEFGGFEGNAQSLRIVSTTIFSSGEKRRGMNPTRAFLDGILKYKSLYSELPDPENHFLYDGQAELLGFATGGGAFPSELPPGKARDSFRSIECQIMDWADDTAYSLNDVVDSVRAGFLRADKIERWGAEANLAGGDAATLEELLRSIRERKTESVFGRKIGEFLSACTLRPWDNFLSAQSHRYRHRLEIDPAVREQAALFKRLAADLVFRSLQIHQLEYKGDFILARIFTTLAQRYLNGGDTRITLLPESTEARLAEAASRREKARLLCDYVAGMTDGFAVRTYKRLFDPEFGSISDLV